MLAQQKLDLLTNFLSLSLSFLQCETCKGRNEAKLKKKSFFLKFRVVDKLGEGKKISKIFHISSGKKW